jgi:ubiquinone/menaquinone biosynthesis C-methylase UbiE
MLKEQLMAEIWPVRLFRKSYLKQTKYNKMIDALGPTEGRHILEIGSDNGVFSYLFRQRGGSWKSADLDDRSVAAMRELVKTDVYNLDDGEPLPFADNEFDCVLIVDIIEHLHDDTGFMQEVYRVLKPGGQLIVNAPNIKDRSLLMRFRNLIGMTDANHGHVRPGYSYTDLLRLLGDQFTLETYHTHTKFFAKLVDTMVVIAVSALKRNKKEKTSGRGVLVTGSDMKSYKKMFRAYSLIYPIVWLVSSLDHLLFFRSGYMFIATGHSNKN